MFKNSWFFCLVPIIDTLTIPNAVLGQIIPDSSLGSENSLVNGSGNRDTIRGGARRNDNLFHSFQEFNVNPGREAYFTNPNGIANIFSRVTGNNISNIQGVLGVLGNANLFLINPNGILFGENARLEVSGSFFATTADSVVFGNGFEFSAAKSNQPPLLTINIPIGLKFRDNPGDIIVTGQNNRADLDSGLIDPQPTLEIDPDSTINLIGGNIYLDGSILRSRGRKVELASVGENQEVSFNPSNNGLTIGYERVNNFLDIELSQATIDSSRVQSGDILLQGNNITLKDNSLINSKLKLD